MPHDQKAREALWDISEAISDAVPIAKQVIKVARQLHDQVQLVNANKAQCQRLSTRADVIISAIRGLDALPDNRQFKAALGELSGALDKALALVKTFSAEKRYWMRFLFAGSHSNQFHSINDALGRVVTQLNLGLNAQQVMDRKQDQADQQADFHYIASQLGEVHQLMQTMYGAAQTSALEAKQRDALIQQQLASLREQLVQSQRGKRPKPLIDPFLVVRYYNLVFDQVLAKGSFGTIYQGQWGGHAQVAIKTLDGQFTDDERTRLIREIAIMHRLNHPRVMPLYGACLEEGRPCLVMPHCSNGNLLHYTNQQTFSAVQHQRLALEMAQGLNYLHSRGVYHRHLKASNILITEDGHALISDFALSKTQYATIATAKSRSRALEWLAPEVLRDEKIENPAAADVYGYGMLLWTMLTGRKPFAEYTAAQITRHVAPHDTPGGREDIPTHTPPFYAQLIRQCWAEDPSERPSMVDICQQLHAYKPPSLSPAPEVLYRQGQAAYQSRDYKTAVTHYRHAAEQGHPAAQTQYALCLLKGRGVTVDKPLGYTWLTKAVDNGHHDARYYLAEMQRIGDQVPQDKASALTHYRHVASRSGFFQKQAQQRVTQLSQAADYPTLSPT